MRELDEIQRAHDILWSQVTGETPPAFEDEVSRRSAAAALDVLCWVLRHDHSDGFVRSLADIEAHLASRGYVLRKSPTPFVRGAQKARGSSQNERNR